jgi:methionyl aminopeptidase
MVKIKTEQEINIMRQAGKMLAEIFEIVAENIKVGQNAEHLESLVLEEITKIKALPSFLGYHGYKNATCISKNEEIVHGIPYAHKVLFPGDICGVDIGLQYQGFHVDAARTYMVEPVATEVQKLVKITEECFYQGLQEAQPGKRLGDVANALQTHAERHGFSVVKALCSHGIGQELHEEPLIPNYGAKGQGLKLKPGMTFALEPMINMGTDKILTLEDKWTIITADKKWSSHYENTICITENGPEILTKL